MHKHVGSRDVQSKQKKLRPCERGLTAPGRESVVAVIGLVFAYRSSNGGS